MGAFWIDSSVGVVHGSLFQPHTCIAIILDCMSDLYLSVGLIRRIRLYSDARGASCRGFTL